MLHSLPLSVRPAPSAVLPPGNDIVESNKNQRIPFLLYPWQSAGCGHPPSSVSARTSVLRVVRGYCSHISSLHVWPLSFLYSRWVICSSRYLFITLSISYIGTVIGDYGVFGVEFGYV
jgi:hypothetical protein